jgi:prohibitin 1
MRVRFSPIHENIAHLHKTFGEKYKHTMVLPGVRSVTRQVMGQYSIEDIYTFKRSEIEALIKEEIEKTLEEKYVEFNHFFITSIQLPPKLRDTLEERWRQQAEEMKLKNNDVSK